MDEKCSALRLAAELVAGEIAGSQDLGKGSQPDYRPPVFAIVRGRALPWHGSLSAPMIWWRCGSLGGSRGDVLTHHLYKRSDRLDALGLGAVPEGGDQLRR